MRTASSKSSTTRLQQAAEHLRTYDPILRPIIAREGTADIQPHTNYYSALISDIIGQQLSVKAAAAIRRKFLSLFNDIFPSPAAILAKTPDELRVAGLSWAKVKYVQDLAQHVLDGKITFDHFDTLSNEKVIHELVDIKGIGEWTAHMFLIFCMGRLDVLPVGDLGIKNGIRALYQLKDMPTPNQIVEIATENHWHPYESVACWYIWASLDNKPNA